MAIHHATVKKAEKMGVMIEEAGDGFRVFWPKRAVQVFGVSTSDALQQMQAVQAIVNRDETIRFANDETTPRLVFVHRGDDILKGSPLTPFEAHQILTKDADEWVDGDEFGRAADPLEPDMSQTLENQQPVAQHVERSENGVALDGAIAYKEGTPAGDNPYPTDGTDEEYALAEAWDEKWDAAADAADEEEGSKGGSVVSERYRAKYAELGHPTHCGDWLANLLNNLCIVKEGTDLGRFETICEANGVDLSKYNRDRPGWQGRLRMTGRNLLAKRVYFAGGVVQTPVDGAEPTYKAPADWMELQRFKMPKADQAKPIPEAAE